MARHGFRHRVAGSGLALALVASLTGAPAVAASSTATAAGTAATGMDALAFPKTIAYASAQAAATLAASPGASSLSVAFTTTTGIAWTGTFGAVDAAGTKPAATTMFGAGSVSKMLAAAAVMRLVDMGLVGLDQPVHRYVPDFTMADPAYRQITVRMLLSHTAGLPGGEYGNLVTAMPFPDYEAQLLRNLADARLKTTPGAMAVYCNDCFTMAQIVVHRVSGQTYADFVHDQLFVPLGMTHSAYPTAPFAAGSYAPVLNEDGSAQPQEYLNAFGTGGLYTTPADLARFSQMLLNGGVRGGTRVLSAASVAAMGADQTVTTEAVDGWRMPYGLGWDSVAQGGLHSVGQAGWIKGGDSVSYHATDLLAPDAGLAVTAQLAGHGSSATLEGLAERILQRALVERGTLAAMPSRVASVTLPSVTPTAAQKAAMTGFWAEDGTVRRITFAGSTLRMDELADGAWVAAYALTLRTDGRWWSGDGRFGLTMGTSWGRRYITLRMPGGWGEYWTTMVIGQRVTSQEALSPAWAARVGQTWLMSTELPGSAWWGQAATTITSIPGLTGYIATNTNVGIVDPAQDDAVAYSFIVVPGALGRDLEDVRIEDRLGAEWLRFGSSVLRPAAGLGSLTAGAYAAKIEDGLTTSWMRLDGTASVLSTVGADAWYLYDATFASIGGGLGDASSVAHPDGAYLAVVGSAGDTIGVDLVVPPARPSSGAAGGAGTSPAHWPTATPFGPLGLGHVAF